MKLFGVTLDTKFVATAVLTLAVGGLVGWGLRAGGNAVGGTVGDMAKKAADIVD